MIVKNTFTKEELELIDAALTHYWNFNHQEHERKKAKGRKNCNWHVAVMVKTADLQSKNFLIFIYLIFYLLIMNLFTQIQMELFMMNLEMSLKIGILLMIFVDGMVSEKESVISGKMVGT